MTNSNASSEIGCGTYLIVTVILAVIAAICCGAYSWGSENTMTCSVEEKDRTKDSSGSSDMRLYTEECGILQVGDSWARGNFNSADDYAAIETGETYEFTTIGWRIPFLSMFPTVIEFRDAE